jgi:hypothetical protein
MKSFFIKLAAIFSLAFFAPGCVAVVPAVVAVKVHKHRKAKREEARKEYETYRQEAEKENAARKQAGLPPEPVLTEKEWRAKQDQEEKAPAADSSSALPEE